MARQARVSVCIPSHNSAGFLPTAIDSVLAQEFDDFELIISDDASTDETQNVCERYNDPRFRTVRSERRLGLAGNWNRCVELAGGSYIILLHADDELRRGYLRQAVELLDANDDVAFVHCAVQHIDERGRPLFVQRLFSENRVDRDETTLRNLLLDGCVVSPAGVLVRREAFEGVGRFTDKTVWAVDWHMWIRIALRWPLAYLAEPLAHYREHGHSGTSSVMASGRNARDEIWALEDLFALIERTRPELSALRGDAIRGVAHRTWCFAEARCEAGEMGAARTGLRHAVRIWPPMMRQPKVWALWAATFTGYGWFAAANARKRRAANAQRRDVTVT